ncbi:uncharacterized protein LOC117805940 [Notolabrus celidotus]|uniref:uncharacterized protein LOC117805940 n=1 Tax=Notolabrus celidotus TaxID=1203425 RepID=UPI00148FAA08|nr:uncharacterized protein LOC117805940 [Notolabrus celidotus]
MGSTSSRPRLHKVAPCNSQQEEGDQLRPQWTLPALPVSAEQSSGSLGQKKTTLPPLKQEITLSTLSEPCFTGNIPPKQSNHSSIIHSHPPRRPQALQPLAVQIGTPSTANQFSMGRGCRDGGVQQFSTTGPAGISGTSRMTQAGFLEAQMALTQQDHRLRRGHLRQARELRRHKVVYTANVGNPDEIQRLKLVRRTTERDIFYDEATGERLDPSCLLDPEYLPQLREEQQSQTNKQLLCRGDRIHKNQAKGPRNREEGTLQTEFTGLSLDKNLSWTSEKERKGVDESEERQSASWMQPEFMSNCDARKRWFF